jgi:putative sterol carrier protein
MKTRTLHLCVAAAAAVGLSLCHFAPPVAAAESPAKSAEAPSKTPADVFEGMRKSFRADKAKGVHARYQWNLSGPAGGNWWITVDDGTFKMGKGTIDKPDVTFETSDEDWVRLSNGTLGGTRAFLTGRLKVHGSQAVARKLDEIFP